MSLEAALVQQQRRRHAARAGAHDDRAPACAKAGRNRRVERAACAGGLGATDLHPAGMRADAPIANNAGAGKGIGGAEFREKVGHDVYRSWVCVSLKNKNKKTI